MHPTQQLADIPLERVQDAVKALLDLDSVAHVVNVEIGPDVVKAKVFALDSEGHMFLNDGEPATHELVRRVLV